MSSNNSVLGRTGLHTPLPGQETRGRWRNRHKSSEMTELDVKNYLIKKPEVFESYVLESVSLETLQLLIQKKQEKPEKGINLDCATIPLQERFLNDSVKEISSHLIDIVEDHDIYAAMSETVSILARAVNANHTCVYIPTHQNHQLRILRDGKLVAYGPTGLGTTVAAHAVIERKSILIDDIEFDSR